MSSVWLRGALALSEDKNRGDVMALMKHARLTVHDLRKLKGKRQMTMLFVETPEEAAAAAAAGIDILSRHRQVNDLRAAAQLYGRHVDCPRCSLPPPSLSSGGHQPCGLALFPVSPEPSHGRRKAGGARDLRDLRDRAPVGEEVRQGIRRPDPPARACSRRQMAYG